MYIGFFFLFFGWSGEYDRDFCEYFARERVESVGGFLICIGRREVVAAAANLSINHAGYLD